MMRCLLLSLACLSTTSASLLWPPDWTRSIWLSSAIIGNYLYIDGGEVYTNDQGISSTTFGSTLFIDLTQSWTNKTVQARAFDKPTTFPFARQPWIWGLGSQPTLQALGGWVYGYSTGWFSNTSTFGDVAGTTDQKLWGLSLDSGEWTESTSQPPSDVGIGAGYLSTSGNGTAYGLGGAFVSDPSVAAFGFTGMAEQDINSLAWVNVSTNSYGADGYGAYGQAVYTETYGNQGILIFLGGYAPLQQNFVWSSSSSDSLQDMGKITIYDIETQTFTQQPATGNVPGPRWGFCAVGSETADGSGFDVYIHGGFYGDQAPVNYESGYDDIWSMRALHTCQYLNNGQMIVVGGDNPNSTGYGASTDPWPNAVGIFDMSSLTWANNYNPTESPYSRASSLVSMIGSNVYPSTGASQLGLDLFGTQGGGGGGDGDGDGGGDGGGGGGTPVGAIAGGVIGGIAIIGLVAALVFFCFIRRRKRKGHEYVRSPSEEDTAYKAELDGTPATLRHSPPYRDVKSAGVVNVQERPNEPVELDNMTPNAMELDTDGLDGRARRGPRGNSERDVFEMQG